MPNSLDAFKARIRVDLSVIIAGFLLLAGLLLLFYQHDQEEEDAQWVIHTYQVIDQLKAVEALLVDAETGVRGYVATGDTLFLQPYRQALPRLRTNLKTLPGLVADNPAQQRKVQQLSRLAQAKVAVVDQLVKNKATQVPLPLLALGKQRMDAVRKHIANMVSIERTLMNQRTQRVQTTYRTTNLLTGLVLLLALLAFWQAYMLIQRELNRREQAQHKARQSAELLQTVVDNVPSGIVLYQAIRNAAREIIDFGYLLSNPVNDQVTGRRAGELLGLSLLQNDPATRTNGVLEDLIGVVHTGEPLHRLRHYESDRIHGWFDTQYHKQDDGVLFTYLDVTAIKQAELTQQQQAVALQTANQELQRSNASLQSFAYIAGHDLQEPLRKIEAFGNLLQQQYGAQLDASAADYLNRMQSAARRMGQLIRDLLAYSRVSSTPLVFRPVNVAELVADILDDLDVARQQAGALITVGELPTLPGDPTQLSQLMLNLLSNAIKFSTQPPGGRPAEIRIESQSRLGADLPNPSQAEPSARFWEISIHDNGIGFDTQHLERIFEVFQRLNSRQEFSGSGIGLAICKRVAENHGGQITVVSAPGQGATFMVYLPA